MACLLHFATDVLILFYRIFITVLLRLIFWILVLSSATPSIILDLSLQSQAATGFFITQENDPHH